MPTTIPFGPQLIGQTEKALTALLRQALDGRLTEPQWVALRLAEQSDEASAVDLADFITDRAHFPDGAGLVRALNDAGLVRGGRFTPAGRGMIAEVQAQIEAADGDLWIGLPQDDVDAATRILNQILGRARAALR